jgi:hypothetical protein
MQQIIHKTELSVEEQEIHNCFYIIELFLPIVSASFAGEKNNKSEGSYRQNYHVCISVFILRNGLVLPLRQVFATPLILLPPVSVRDFCRKWSLISLRSRDIGQRNEEKHLASRIRFETDGFKIRK